MKLTTLCYIEKDGCYLMMHRIKKKNDANHDKWIGVGGKFEEGEAPEECLLRETLEETGLTLTQYRFRGVVTFVSDAGETEDMHLFTADGYEGALRSVRRASWYGFQKQRLWIFLSGRATGFFCICCRRRRRSFH